MSTAIIHWNHFSKFYKYGLRGLNLESGSFKDSTTVLQQLWISHCSQPFFSFLMLSLGDESKVPPRQNTSHTEVQQLHLQAEKQINPLCHDSLTHIFVCKCVFFSDHSAHWSTHPWFLHSRWGRSHRLCVLKTHHHPHRLGKPLQDFPGFILPVNNPQAPLVPLTDWPHDSLLEAPSSAEPCLYHA